ncbi:MAG: transcription-repair coupling factor [Chloroflexi bacterium]|nr:transcription-repair coupling factor [Chloroflexota bacterium]
MRLSGLLPLLVELPEFRQLVVACRAASPTPATTSNQDAGAVQRCLPPAAAQGVVREAAKPFLVAGLQQHAGRPVVLVAPDDARAHEWYQDLLLWSAAPEHILHFPAFSSLPFEQLPAVAETVAARVGALVELSGDPHPRRETPPLPSWETGSGGESPSDTEMAPGGEVLPYVVVASIQALLFAVAPPDEFGRRVVTLRKGGRQDLDDLVHRLAAMGYERAGLVETPGSFSRRGGIVDIFPPLVEAPVRLEFFGDEIESLRTFDPATQRSTGELETLQLAPATELPLWRGGEAAAALRALDWSTLRPEIREEWEWQVRDLEAGSFFVEAPFFARYLHTQPGSLLDYVPDALVVLDEPKAVLECLDDFDAQAAELRQKLTEAGAIPTGFETAYLSGTIFLRRLAEAATIHLSYRPATVPLLDEAASLPLTPGPSPTRGEGNEGGAPPLPVEHGTPPLPLWERGPGGEGFEFTSFDMAPTFGGRIKDVVETTRRRRQERQRVVLVSQQSSRLAELYADRGTTLVPQEQLDRVPERGTLTLVHGQLGEGWANAPLGVFLLTDTEVFGWAKPRRVIRRRRIAKESFLSELRPGDFVVHVEHGIAQYQGLVKRRTEAGEREYLLLQFAGSDRVYVPTDQLDRVDRYIGVGDHVPALSKLGGAEWERAKNRVKQSVAEIAKGLLELYSQRELAQGHAFSPDNEWQHELEESFPYVETPDQLVAIADVKRDMEHTKPMDRLVCGDVGFGKTEVAVRAAFKAVQDGKQVAILVPTTVLALQHFQTFRQRIQAYPITVELLSRFRTAKEQEAVLEGMRRGTVDVVIGTHRLLSKDVKFKDLGLLVIDEEQRFGVTHKERIKQLRAEVHVLTLTATPIPRTLHMSLIGLRDMSVIETPPEARLPIKTYVTGYHDDLVREAILREVDRGGQVYFVHNRVQTIESAAAKLRRLVPEVDVAVGHGQMDEEALERVMVEFSQGSHDVLVCSTIIESGLDIPNVNTIVVNEAGNFGLAQLYQLRGRVGRSGNQAFAYLLYDPHRRLTETAERRLRTIFEATDLGAGFKIAMKDLEIRGAGNLLGPEQSGFMNTVGFDLYCRLLAQAVDELRGKRTLPAYELMLDLPLGAHLPDSYIGDPDLKVRLYRRLATLETEAEVREVRQEFKDRFGPLPPPVADMFYLLELKMLAKQRYLRGIEAQGSTLLIRMSPFVVSDRLALYKAFGTSAVVRNGQIRLPKQPQPQRWKEDLLKALRCLRVVEPKGVASGAPVAAAAEPAPLLPWWEKGLGDEGLPKPGRLRANGGTTCGYEA